MPPQDTTTATVPGAWGDPHGRAALLLVESLIHGLIRRKTLTSNDAIRIIELAAEVDQAIHDEKSGNTIDIPGTVVLLNDMANSLRRDLGR